MNERGQEIREVNKRERGIAFVCIHLLTAKQEEMHIDSFIDQLKEVLKMDEQIHSLSQELYQQKSLLVMGRGYNYATCLEGALVKIYTMYSSRL